MELPGIGKNQSKGIIHGLVFQNQLGPCIKASELEPKFFECLKQFQEPRPDLIPDNIDIADEYGIYCSFRHGSTLTTVNQGSQQGCNRCKRQMEKIRTTRHKLTCPIYEESQHQ